MTDDITLRKVDVVDVPRIQDMASDPAISEMTRIPFPYPDNGAAEFVHHTLEAWKEGTEYSFAILCRDELVGLCGFHAIDLHTRSAEFGYWIGKKFWGRGFATAATRLAVEVAFTRLNFSLVRAPILERNAASRRVAEKNGFSLAHRKLNDEPRWLPTDIILTYQLDRQKWLDAKQENDTATHSL